MDFALKIKDEDIKKKAYELIILYVLEKAPDVSRMAKVMNFVEQLPEIQRFGWRLRIALQLTLGMDDYYEVLKNPEEALRCRFKEIIGS